jgi:hypothetical protein
LDLTTDPGLAKIKCAGVVVVAHQGDVPRLTATTKTAVHDRAGILIVTELVHVGVHALTDVVALFDGAWVVVIAINLNTT